MLEVYKTTNNFPNCKKKFAFRSRNPQTITQDEFIDLIANANTTITKSDTIAVFSEMENQFNKVIASGNALKLFVGTFRAGASGSAENAEDTFSPKPKKDKRTPKKDHKISLLFEPEKSMTKLIAQMKYKFLGLVQPCHTAIYHIKRIGYPEKDTISPSDVIEIKGSFIKIDPNDNEQGVFLSASGSIEEYRLSTYLRCSRVTIDAQLPKDIPAGDYFVFVKTKSFGISNSHQITIEGCSSN